MKPPFGFALVARVASPLVKLGDGPRPQSTPREDLILGLLATWTLISLFWDGIIHNNETGQDSFFSAAHISMYLGLAAIGVWILVVLLRRQDRRPPYELNRIPLGYGLALLALPMAALAGPADFIWHELYGFENQTDSAYSASHQFLFLSGALLAAIPLASAWRRRGVAPTFQQLFPAILAATLVLAVGLFVAHLLSPFYAGGFVPTDGFQDDIARYPDAYAPGSNVDHVDAMAQALVNYGDRPWPYYFYSTMAAVAGIVIWSAALVGTTLYLLRRWRLPFGTVTFMWSGLGFLFAMIDEYRSWELIPVLILGGLAGDLILHRVSRFASRPSAGRIFAIAAPPILWILYFLDIAVLGDGLGWEPTIWFGMITTSAGVGFAVSLLAFPSRAPDPLDDAQSDAAIEAERREAVGV
jgi:hypothetical protein